MIHDGYSIAQNPAQDKLLQKKKAPDLCPGLSRFRYFFTTAQYLSNTVISKMDSSKYCLSPSGIT